jgi:hypothetical protein
LLQIQLDSLAVLLLAYFDDFTHRVAPDVPSSVVRILRRRRSGICSLPCASGI